MAIRWNSQLKSDVRRVVKSFNAKVRRLQNKGVTAALLPDKISSKEIQAGITNRRDLYRRLDQLREFTSAGEVERSEGGVMGTNKLFMYRVGEANKAINAIKQEFKRLGTVETRYPMMKSEYQANLEAKMDYLSRNIRQMDVRQIQIFNKNLLTPERSTIKKEIFYNSFNKMIYQNAQRAGIEPSQLTRVIELMEKLTPDELLELYSTNPAFRSVRDIYMLSKNNATSDKDIEDSVDALEGALIEQLKKKSK